MRYVRVMKHKRALLNLVVAAGLTLAPITAAGQQNDGASAEALLEELARPDQERWQRLERQILREWERSGSAVADYLYQRGQAALAEGDTRAAIDHLSAVIDHAPDFAEAWHARATAWYLENRLGLALADLERALALNPRHFGVLSGVGAILEQLDRPEEAREAYEAALALHPHRPSLREALERLAQVTGGRDA